MDALSLDTALLPSDAARAVIRELIAGGEHWLILGTGTGALDLGTAIVSTHYRGPAGKDVILAMLPPNAGLGAVLFLGKARMRRHQLVRILRRFAAEEHAAIDDHHDIIVPVTEDRPETEDALARFMAWLDAPIVLGTISMN
jgi:hypothetical protein